jgi:RNA-directed DNA polymerase
MRRVYGAKVTRLTPGDLWLLKAKLRALWRRGRGRSLRPFIAELTPILRGWTGCFRLSEVKGIFEALDGWVRRRLRVILWRQWKRPRTRAQRLMQLGLACQRARHSVYNGHGPWWNAGASHRHHAVPTRLIRHLGLVSCLDQYHRLARSH